MAKILEESVMNATMESFVSQEQVSNPRKSYMAIGNCLPKVGECFYCSRLEKNGNGKLGFYRVKTSTVQEVRELARNVFFVSTRNSDYVTRVLYMPVKNVHFAIVKNSPTIGSKLNCDKLVFKGEKIRLVNCNTTTVQEVEKINGLYKVKTKNSVYVCFPM